MQYTKELEEQQEELEATTKALEDIQQEEEFSNEDGQDFIEKVLSGKIR